MHACYDSMRGKRKEKQLVYEHSNAGNKIVKKTPFL